MKKMPALIVALSGLTLSACYPMEQASLVYSASHSLGVDVEAGTPTTPGLLVSIGYRSLNAAFVPVAVAIHCPEQDAVRCDSDTYRMREISGRSDHASAVGSQAHSREALSSRLGAYDADVSRLRGEITELEAVQRENANRRLELPGLDQRRTALAENEDALGLAEVNRQMAEINALESEESVAQRLANRRASLTRVETDRNNVNQQLTALATVRDDSADDDKHDSFSVYGSFDGSAGGDNDGASLTVGQVFSTGVAAQHLTQGLAAGALLAYRARCLEAMRDLAAEMGDAGGQLRNQASSVCNSK